MKKVKLFIAQSYSGGYGDNEDEYSVRIKRDFQDWTELSDQEYESLFKYKDNITSNLKSKGILSWDEELVIIREPSNEEVSQIKIDLKEIIDSTAKKEKAKEEKEKKRVQKLQQTAEEKKKAKELAQLKKLQEKYGEK